MESGTMSQPTRFFITCMASCLLLSAGGRVALGQTPNGDTVRLALLPREEYGNDSQWLDQGSNWLDQQQQWFNQLEQDKLLGKVPATGVSYRLENGPGTGGEALGNLIARLAFCKTPCRSGNPMSRPASAAVELLSGENWTCSCR